MISHDQTVVDYTVVYGEDGMSDVVPRWINDGWQPYGAPFSHVGPQGALTAQALVKYAEPYTPTSNEQKLRDIVKDVLTGFEVEMDTVLPALQYAHRRGYATADSQQKVIANNALIQWLLVVAAELGITPNKKEGT